MKVLFRAKEVCVSLNFNFSRKSSENDEEMSHLSAAPELHIHVNGSVKIQMVINLLKKTGSFFKCRLHWLNVCLR